MTIRPICITGEPVLHERALEVTNFGPELRALVADMFETMDKAPGVGLAAPQIGVGLRVFTYDYDDDEGNDASSMTCNKGDNHNRNDGEDACASTATTPAHRRRRRHSQS